jgi:high affinity sulfate transporter 1
LSFQQSELTNARRGQSRLNHVARWFPGLAILKKYTFAVLARDILAGIALTAILIPAGMGYAQAAGLPAIFGLYATITPLIVYAVFGPSRILVLGPDSTLAALIAATILPMAAGDESRALALASMLAIIAGILCFVAGLCQLGLVTDLLSKPIRYGYINGIALTVLIGQIPKMLGFSVTGGDIFQQSNSLLIGVLEGKINLTATAISLACLAIILGCKYWLPKVPGILISVIIATIAVWMFELESNSSLSVVGALPPGIPGLRIPAISTADIRSLFPGALAIALVSFADISVLSRTYAHKFKHDVNANQELLSLGLCNFFTGLFQGFPVSGSASRTPVAESAGAKTQLAGLVGALCLILLLITAPRLLVHLPIAALGAVVACACLSQIEISGVLRLYHVRRSELASTVVCFLGVLLFGVIEGIFVSVTLALLAFIWRAWRPYDAVLGRVDGLKGYHDISRHPEAHLIPGLVLFRWDAPLFFANATIFQDHVLRAVAAAPTQTQWVVVAAEPVTDIDITAADMLAELDHNLQESGIELCFAELKGPVKDRLKKYGLFDSFGTEFFFPTIGQAVDRYVAKHQVEWKDWEDEACGFE